MGLLNFFKGKTKKKSLDHCSKCGESLPSAYKGGPAVISGSPWGYCESCKVLYCPNCSDSKAYLGMQTPCCPKCRKNLTNPTMIL